MADVARHVGMTRTAEMGLGFRDFEHSLHFELKNRQSLNLTLLPGWNGDHHIK
jgi:hypothetical protein